jgi:hypothetical protein
MIAFGYTWAPMTAAIIIGFSGFLVSRSYGEPFTGNDKRVMGQAIDMLLIMGWMAGPALKRVEAQQGRYLRAEEAMIDSSMPLEIRDKMFNYEDLIFFVRQSIASQGIPLKAIRRHNRAFKPGLLRKKSASYTILGVVARIIVEAGGGRNAAAWYYEAARKLKIPYKHSQEFIEAAFYEQMQSPSMIPGLPDEDSLLGRAGQGIEQTAELAPYLDAYEASRKRVLDLMFPDSRAA